MTTLSEKLTAILAAKAGIKTAIENIDVDLTDISFSDYASTLDTEFITIENKIVDILGEDISPGELWTPANVETDAWYDANDLTTITKDGSNLISAWNDKSGNARHATIGADYPTHYYDTTLEKWVVRFNGTSNRLLLPLTYLENSNYAIHIVTRRLSNKALNYFIGGTQRKKYSLPHLGWRSDKVLTQAHFNNDWDIPINGFTTPIIESFCFTVESGVGANAFYGGVKHFDKNTAIIPLVDGGDVVYFGMANTTGSNLWYYGDILECIINKTVDANVINKIQAYLVNKWNAETNNNVYI